MSQYKELADAVALAATLCKEWKPLEGFDETKLAEAAAILRSLDAKPPFEIDWPEYHSLAMGCGLEDRDITDRYEAMYYGWCQAIERMAESLPEPLYAAPVAAQPPFPQGSWQHAVDDQLVEWGRTSQEFESPHDAVRWLIEQEVLAAQPPQAKPEPLSDADYYEIGQRYSIPTVKIQAIHRELEAKRGIKEQG